VRRLSAKPVIRIEAGQFVLRLGGDEYAIGPVYRGVACAIGKMSELRREVQTNLLVR